MVMKKYYTKKFKKIGAYVWSIVRIYFFPTYFIYTYIYLIITHGGYIFSWQSSINQMKDLLITLNIPNEINILIISDACYKLLIDFIIL